jgi:hypothetical protein
MRGVPSHSGTSGLLQKQSGRKERNMKVQLRFMAALLILALGFFQAQAQVKGSGTKGKVPVWTDSTTLGDSKIAQGTGGIKVSGTGTAVSGVSSSKVSGASGVLGQSTAKTGVVNGVVGIAASNTNGTNGVLGFASGVSGTVFGVQGSTASTGGVGVLGVASATSGAAAGVVGTSASPNGNGMQASATATEGTANGIYASTATSGGAGVVGANTATSGGAIGVVGYTASPGGAGGVFDNVAGGTSLILIGNGGSNYTQVFNVDASGNAFFKGNVSKSGGSFKIDHPLDPANKYLSHSFVESPDMVNLYNGNITTDQRGIAVVVLPDYFEALNRDFRYQLTVLGQFAQAIVAQEIDKGRFTIKTDKPSVKVSWQVTGVRQDAFANAHRIQVEEEKPALERGHYLHPELFGATEEEAIGATSHPAMTLPVTAAVMNGTDGR